MQIGNGQVPFRLNFEPLNIPPRQPARVIVSRSLTDGPAQAAQARARQLTAAARETVQQKDRTEVYREVSSLLGNVREALSVPAGESASGASVQKIADSLQATISYLDSVTAKGGARPDDALLRDIREGLQGLFTTSGDESLKGLGDLGVTQENGQISVDAERLAELQTERPEELEAFVGTFIGEKASPLVNAATQALADAEARGPLEQSLAQKAVAVQADISRLESRKQTLVSQQTQFAKLEENLKQQAESLRKTRRQLEQAEARELPPDVLDFESRRTELVPDPSAGLPEPAKAPQTPPPTNLGMPTPPVAPGLSSFGLS